MSYFPFFPLGVRRGLAATCCMLLVFLASSHAAAITWNGGSGNWSVSGNWTPAQIPGDGDDVTINSGSVSLTNSTGSLSSLTMGGGTLTFSNWDTKLSATNVNINSGSMTIPASFTNGAMSNRVWIACSNLTIASGASINVDGKGYLGGTTGAKVAGHGPGAGA